MRFKHFVRLHRSKNMSTVQYISAEPQTWSKHFIGNKFTPRDIFPKRFQNGRNFFFTIRNIWRFFKFFVGWVASKERFVGTYEIGPFKLFSNISKIMANRKEEHEEKGGFRTAEVVEITDTSCSLWLLRFRLLWTWVIVLNLGEIFLNFLEILQFGWFEI